MNNYQLYRTKDGQSTKKDGTILASNFNEACEEFTSYWRSKLADDNGNIVYYDAQFYRGDYEAPGYYNTDVTPSEAVLLDNEVITSFSFPSDVWTYEITEEIVTDQEITYQR